jgi:hypothetical protein
LGLRIAALPEDQRGRLLRETERLAVEVRELDLEILLERRGCRSLAAQELEEVRGSTNPAHAQREADLLRLLERRLAEDWGGALVFVEPDSADGFETLLDKQAYLTDLKERIVALQKNLDRRITRTRREQGLRRASEGFAEESRFLDEGGRVGSDDVVLLRGLGGNDDPGNGQGRLPTSGSGLEDPAEMAGEAGGAPPDSELAVLSRARGDLEQSLARVAELLHATESYLRLYPAATP